MVFLSVSSPYIKLEKETGDVRISSDQYRPDPSAFALVLHYITYVCYGIVDLLSSHKVSIKFYVCFFIEWIDAAAAA